MKNHTQTELGRRLNEIFGLRIHDHYTTKSELREIRHYWDAVAADCWRLISTCKAVPCFEIALHRVWTLLRGRALPFRRIHHLLTRWARDVGHPLTKDQVTATCIKFSCPQSVIDELARLSGGDVDWQELDDLDNALLAETIFLSGQIPSVGSTETFGVQVSMAHRFVSDRILFESPNQTPPPP